MAFFQQLVAWVVYFFSGSLRLLMEMVISSPPVPLVLFLLLLIAWLGAACWAAEIAETANLVPYKHFWLGLLLPFFYTLRLKQKYQSIKPQAESPPLEVAAEALARVEAATGGIGPVPLDEDGSLEITLDAIGFRRLKRAGLISPASPCIIVYGSNEVKVTNLFDALDACAVVEAEANASGQKSRLRIPYHLIKSLTFEP